MMFQIMFLNLLVSLDNVGIISIAAKDYSNRQAAFLRAIGIGSSPFFVLAFLWISSYLFGVEWLHIRIIGGLLMIYVTYHMLMQSGTMATKKTSKRSLLAALVSILASNLTMAMENAMSILSVLSKEGGIQQRGDWILVITALGLCMPILFWGSGAISRWMDRFPVIIFFCAGYLIYSAMGLVFEDYTVNLFFQAVHFTFIKEAAVLTGICVAASGVVLSWRIKRRHFRRRLVLALSAFLTLGYAIATIGLLSFLNSHPVIDGYLLSVEKIYGFTLSGVETVYVIGTPPHLFSILVLMMAIHSGIFEGAKFFDAFKNTFIASTVFMSLYLVTCILGIGYDFGMGNFTIQHVFSFLAQIVLHSTYAAVFCRIAEQIKNPGLTVILSLLYIIMEDIVVDILIVLKGWYFLAGFFPEYYIHSVANQRMDLLFFYRILLVSGVYILFAANIGREKHKKT